MTPPPVIDPGASHDPAASVLERIVRILEAQGVAYAFTGAFALAYWAQPRGTKDIDVVVLLSDRQEQAKLLEELLRAGFVVPPGALDDLARAPHYSTGLLATLGTGAKLVIEILAPKPGEEKLTARTVQRAKMLPFPGVTSRVRVVTAEDLVVYKLLLFRKGEGAFETDDLRDIEMIVAMCPDLDVGYVTLSLSTLGLDPEASSVRSRWFEKVVRRRAPHG